MNGDSTEIYQKHRKIKESLTYSVIIDLDRIESIQEAIRVNQGSIPRLFSLYHQGRISLETVAIVISIVRPVAYWKKHRPDDPLLNASIFKANKFKGFVDFDREKFKALIKERL